MSTHKITIEVEEVDHKKYMALHEYIGSISDENGVEVADVTRSIPCSNIIVQVGERQFVATSKDIAVAIVELCNEPD